MNIVRQPRQRTYRNQQLSSAFPISSCVLVPAPSSQVMKSIFKHPQHLCSNFDSRKMKELRNFLAQQKALQVEFIVLRFNQTLSQIVLDFPESVRPEIEDIIRTIISSQDSLGLYALIDYAGAASDDPDSYGDFRRGTPQKHN